jgi:hypothetical protein
MRVVAFSGVSESAPGGRLVVIGLQDSSSAPFIVGDRNAISDVLQTRVTCGAFMKIYT